MTRRGRTNRGLLGVVASAATFGALAFFATLALRADVNPLVFVSFRFGFAAVALAPMSRPAARPMPGALASAVLLGALIYAGQALTLTSALERADTSIVAILFGTYPVFVFVLMLPRTREHLTPGLLVPLVGVVAGGSLIVGGAGASSVDAATVALVLASAALFAAFVVVSDQLVPVVEPLLLALLCCIGASVSMLALTISIGRLQLSFDAAGWVWIAAAGLLSTAFAFTALFRALPAVGPTAAGVVLGAEPLASVALAALFLNDELRAAQLVGAGLTVCSVALVQRALGRRRDAPDLSPAGASGSRRACWRRRG